MKLLSRAGSFSVSTAGGFGEGWEQLVSKGLRPGGAWFGVPGLGLRSSFS